MNKTLIVLLLTISCTLAVQLRKEAHKDNWAKIDVDNLNDGEKDLDSFIRDAIDKLDGDLTGAAKEGELYRYVYKNGDNENWDVKSKRDSKGNNEILVATRTETYPDEKDPNLTINKKTSIVKKAFSKVLEALD